MSEHATEVEPSSAIENARKASSWTLFITGTAIVLLTLLVFYPKTSVSMDEMRYMSLSRYLLNGKAYDPTSEAWFWKQLPDGKTFERTLYAPSPAFSALLTPFVAINWRSACLLGTLAHIGAFGGLIYLMRRRGLHPAWALLYLLHPTAVLYSRMVMADLPSAALFVLALVLLHRGRPSRFCSGLVMGAAVLLKLSNAPIVAVFGLGCLVTSLADRENRSWVSKLRGPVVMALGMLPGLVALVTINWVCFNSPTGNGYIGMADGYFGWRYFVSNFPWYLGALMLAYPFMLIAPAFLGGTCRWEMRLSCVAVLLFFGAFYFHDVGNTWYESIIRGLRFQIIVMPFYIIAYAHMLTWVMKRVRWRRTVLAALVLMMVAVTAGDVLLSRKHVEVSAILHARQEELGEVLPGNAVVVTCPMTSKYVNAVLSPELKVINLYSGGLLSKEVTEDDLPATIVLPTPEGMVTEAHAELARFYRENLLTSARKSFRVHRPRQQVAGVDIVVLVEKFPSVRTEMDDSRFVMPR